MYKKPLYQSSDEYRQRDNDSNNRRVSQKRISGIESARKDSQMSAIEKYRSALNLPNRKIVNGSGRNGARKMVISEQAAKLIALSIKGLLNS